MATGKIMKALSGFYYVQAGDELIQCRGRGNFRNRGIKPLVGDTVEYEAENKTDGYILDIAERKNELIRPPIANVDQALLVFSALEPDFSPALLDRFLVHIESNQIEPLIIISKMDLLTEEQMGNISQYQAVYQQLGYRVILTTTNEEDSIEKLLPFIEERISVVAGQSGVGKSSLLNVLKPELDIETNQISTHLGRGKHTTRHVELIPVGQGLIADTPGFSSLDFTQIEAGDLSEYFPEMLARLNQCKFRGCTHTSEPKCAVKEAVDKGDISEQRYQHYLQFLEEINSQKRRYDK
ncbi:GTPase A [Alkalihalobacillus alcalophilus ATCC 27647 = CGMCC 1.3604]|uniref:Small ribosomal subunit biogenesis GTPase RsgA n=1 Tax=Alkalihalobacillus alcalophilus ATCC 27647 = CGMCC 1.3604 TaxID=1218173 RepID=A0A094XG67_ALKAL|nr:ribosome small subunit-dependent GTPase A [Alkalihalobacillus alcalophilus]KGA97740.1 GTPase RsgA [Alkalihalobacillus alcalophilus ATCC 27647 = CGMCC 1.3604]MED1563155.1 ribosome small subunit-dependent GTPase A [Alkalihalobacillus alcalophilus]THG91814.1 GTPase A [Alkalihalobacillus alcalophilus ATCC 27647 = CGMCC 1.3604]